MNCFPSASVSMQSLASTTGTGSPVPDQGRST